MKKQRGTRDEQTFSTDTIAEKVESFKKDLFFFFVVFQEGGAAVIPTPVQIGVNAGLIGVKEVAVA